MIRWVQLATAMMPNNGGELRLMQRGSEYSIMSGPVELMNSRLSGSETALATLAFDAVGARPGARVLIGGLGMGFTLRAALASFAADAAMTVSELVPAVVDWGRGPLADLYAGSLDEPRVTVHAGDVSSLIRAGEAAYDAILLDVDNGPNALTRKENDRLYSIAGLYAARKALTPGGVLAVWSAAPSPAFTGRLRDAGFTVAEVPVRANGAKGARHLIWMATSPG
jgi:spermidine synthase